MLDLGNLSIKKIKLGGIEYGFTTSIYEKN